MKGNSRNKHRSNFVLLWIALIVVFAFNILFILKINTFKKSGQLINKKLEKTTNTANYYINKVFCELKSSNYPIPDSSFIDLIKWKEYKTKHFLNNKLCLYYAEIYCNSCIEEEIYRLKGLSKEIGKENIILFVTYEVEEHFRLFSKLHQIDFNYFRLKRGTFQEIENLFHAPFYFTFNEDELVEHVFIPNRDYNKPTEAFFEKYKRKMKFTSLRSNTPLLKQKQ